MKGFVASSIKNGSAIDAKIELQAIENWAETSQTETVQTKNGYYLLTISAKGFETYQTKVLIPSSSTLEWGTFLEKFKPKVEKVGKNN